MSLSRQKTILKTEEETEDVHFMKAEFIESLPPSAKEYDEKNMFKDGKLSQEFLKVSKVLAKERRYINYFIGLY